MQNSTEQIVDELLVMDSQSGHREAFERLVKRWQKRLWWHAYHLTGHSEAAWDITQDSWLTIVRGLAGLKDPARFGAWAYRIVSNKARDWLHRKGRESPLEIETEAPLASTAEQDQRQTASDVHGILRRLSRRSQVVLNLWYLEGFNLHEVADILRIPEGTVKSRLHAARLEFRKSWELLNKVSSAPIPISGKD